MLISIRIIVLCTCILQSFTMHANDTEILQEDIILAIKKKLGHSNFSILSQSLTTFKEKIGLLGDHSLLNLTIMDGQEEALSFFVKLFPKQESLAEFAHGAGAFQKEKFAYELFQKYKTYGIEHITQCTPNCYIVKTNNYIILDNLEETKYTVANKMEYLDYNSILVILHSLAQLHASSIIYEEKMSEELNKQFRIYEGNEEILRDTLYSDSEDFINKNAADSSLNCVLSEIALFKFPDVLTTGKSFAEAAKENFAKLYQLVKPSQKHRNVLCHGDLWASNIMLKKDQSIFCKLVDFQNVRYVPPAHDVLSVIYLTTSREFRQQHLYELMGIYYNYLEKILKISGYNLSTIIPFTDFLESCEEQKLFAVLSAAAIIPLILSRSDAIDAYYSDKELYHKVFRGDRSVLITDNEDNEIFMARARESIEDLLEECEKFR